MGKKFWEVIPQLQVSDEMRELLELVTIEKVVANKDRSSIRIYIVSERLIHKRNIYILEASIKKQLFGGYETEIKIQETYRLSAQYNPEKLMRVYRDSILLELKMYSLIEYNVFRKAQWEFPEEDILTLEVENDIVTKSKVDELKRVLEKVFNERCGFGIEVRYLYKECRLGQHEKEKEQLTKKQAAQVVRQSSFATAEEEKLKELDEKNEPAVEEKKPAPRTAVKKGGYFGRRSKMRHDDVLFGYDFDDGEEVSLDQVIGEMGEVVICGKVLRLEERELRSGKTIMIFDVTDFTDTITVKMFIKPEMLGEVRGFLKTGIFLKIKGITNIDKFDGELTIASVTGIRKASDFTSKRQDNSDVKRVELHCHTKMSDMDGVSDVKDLIKRARSWGMPAMAITDHGCVQAFPDAFHTFDYNQFETIKTDPFKVIYGVEGYLVDDLKDVVVRSENQSLLDTYVVFDIETTGLSATKNRIIEIGAVKVVNGEINDRFSAFVNPELPIPFEIEKLTGINDSMVIGKPTIETVLPQFLEFCGNSVMVAHNASFDMSFIEHNSGLLGMNYKPTVVDTVTLARILLPELKRYKLDTVAKALGVSLENHHRAVDDAEATAHIFVAFVEKLRKKNVETLDGVNELGSMSVDNIRKMPTYHVIILAKNDTGRVNLYKLISMSHLTYFARRPRIPKSELAKHREGLIIGSACEAGELFQAVLGGAPDEELARLVKFYDYLEVQPIANNAFMLREGKHGIKSEEDLQNLNLKIIELGEQFKKPVVATCDVHFLNPEDEIYRRIIMAGQGFSDCDNQAPLYLRTTEEMLKEFAYLSPEKAYEIVVANSNKIADMCERIAPVRPDKCPPVIENSDVELRTMCYEKAKSIYGNPLPEVVEERLERELHSIITNGFAVMYIIAQKLVHKSNEDGYLVGSRGSVGSSFVATMSGITEVNPLSPHYYCENCHYSEFDSEDVKKFSGGAGCDMPDKDCPVCGRPLKKNGFDIPFETFLGFKGDKEPDIDLNFSGDYQSKAHAYTEVIFGKGHTFRAGTIGTLADKTAFGYVKKYFEERGTRKRNAEINRIVLGCVGVRRTTGQHPGGIVVMPHGEEINSFTPIQHPANDMTTDIVTTHFDYHSIDHNLLKLDILGHDDPTMIRMLEDLTGLDAKEIPLDCKEVMSLFQNTSALKINPEDIGGCRLGALGIPEFGTDFAMQMLIDAKPTCFSDLVRISGLSHGTDVWLGNAQDLILSGQATIQTAICTRDDIMIYLIHMGMDKSLSFTIMEAVRKGKGLKPEWEKAMKESGVPDWYVSSCKKIKYMFPKAHAAAYVMMAWRIAYCKVFYPLAYYAAFFSIRASGFSYEIMCQGRDKLEYYLQDYKNRSDTLSKKEQDTLRDMRIVQEMYARGFEFVPIDIYQAKADKFQIIDGKLMPSLSSIDGLGGKAADAVVEAVEAGERFLSLEDFWQKTKVPKTTIDLMADMGIFGDLPKSNQLSLFDL
ncbi:PolC-type DNA polymerase III [Lacrimispora sp. NSJ-141]|uniref:DNA polymerase III PolC-type n=1 Tax=Lientehia hominis TaxID=2897778 RepID=A0AAP2W802_9FIRM|nr:PolC-type DNA polymerase III [Lientehia hominis]MCD2491620.1 PolC-type DNA polymerase III [Lientehia hominis]